jgi:flagellar M-ring protein FliF
VGASAGAGADTSSSKTATRNYEIDRTLDYTRNPAGRLKRLTVAVLVDNMRVPQKDGKFKDVALTQEQLDHVTQLVKDAVGFDEGRGDNVNVVNASFTTEPAAPEGELEQTPIWETPLFLNMSKLLGGVIVLMVLILSVLKPLIRNLVPPKQATQLIARPDNETTVTIEPVVEGAPLNNGAGNTPALPGADPKAAALTHEQQVAQARTLVGQDPKRVAQVVRGWVNQDD